MRTLPSFFSVAHTPIGLGSTGLTGSAAATGSAVRGAGSMARTTGLGSSVTGSDSRASGLRSSAWVACGAGAAAAALGTGVAALGLSTAAAARGAAAAGAAVATLSLLAALLDFSFTLVWMQEIFLQFFGTSKRTMRPPNLNWWILASAAAVLPSRARMAMTINLRMGASAE